MSVRRVKAGTTDVSVIIRIVDSTDGTPETGVVFNTSGIDLWYRREGAVSTDITEADLATPALTDAHADGGFLHVNDGWYRLDLPDAACASGVTGVQIGGIVTGMVVLAPYIELVAYDPYDTVRLGLTALPNAAADAAGGLPISDAGGLDIDAKMANTNEVTAARMGALTDWIDGGRLDLIIDNILTDTGTTLDGRIPAALVDGRMDASVGAMASGVLTATAIAGDAITAAKVAADVHAEAADAVLDEALSGHTTAGTLGKAVADIETDAAAILLDTAEIGAAGAGLTAINLPDQTMNITGDITGNLSGSVGSVTGAVGSVTGAVGSVTGNVGGNVTGSVGSLAAQAKADVNAEVVDALNVDTYAEIGQETPAATQTIRKMLAYLYKAWRNKSDQTATDYQLYNDDGTTVAQKATVSDDATTFTKGEVATGP